MESKEGGGGSGALRHSRASTRAAEQVIKGSLIAEGFPGGSAVKNPPANAGDTGSTPGLGRSPGGGNGSPLQYYCLENPMDGGAWQAVVHGVAESDMAE